MQTFTLKNDLRLFGVEAPSFPAGVKSAWDDLHKILSGIDGRKFYGLSHGTPDGNIVYTACVEEAFVGEAERLALKTFVLPKGEYIGEIVHDFMKQSGKIGETFQRLLSRNDYDRENGMCVEQYVNGTDVICMIKRVDK